MHIYVDESKIFIPSPAEPNAWSVVAAFMIPDNSVRKLDSIINRLKVKSGKTYKEEVKIGHIKEKDYFKFLYDLGTLNGTLFCAASNMTESTNDQINEFKIKQSDLIITSIDTVKSEEDRKKVMQISEKIRKLSAQLYMQLYCQSVLFDDIIRRGILYYVQRNPRFLKKFIWRIDQKDIKKTDYESAFETLIPIFLESSSIENLPMIYTKFDYSAMSEYKFSKEEMPSRIDYIKNEYGVALKPAGGFNMHRILLDDFSFSDSKSHVGIQIADLLASGIRRLLRGEFHDNIAAASLLGNLLVQNELDKPPIQIISFTGKKIENDDANFAIENISRFCKRMQLSMGAL